MEQQQLLGFITTMRRKRVDTCFLSFRGDQVVEGEDCLTLPAASHAQALHLLRALDIRFVRSILIGAGAQPRGEASYTLHLSRPVRSGVRVAVSKLVFTA